MRTVKSHSPGFTLVELSVVLVLIGLITAMSFSSGITILEAARVTQTNTKIAAIKQALNSYRKAYNRIPCPASLALATTSANFGIEGPKAANCIDGDAGDATASSVTAGNTAAEGAVPVRSLGLPDEFAFDGWGNRFRYATSIAYVATNAFVDIPVNSEIGAIQVNDASGAARTEKAAYAIISQGPNGYGAYSKAGTLLKNTLATNTDEQKNCHCDATGATTYDGIYVQKAMTRDTTNYLNEFDDIAEYGLRWQMQTMADLPTTPTGPVYLALVKQGTAYPILLKFSGDTLTALTPPSQHSTWVWSVEVGDFSPDNSQFVHATNMYQGNPNNTLSTLYDVTPSGLVYNSTNIQHVDDVAAVKISPDGEYLAISGCEFVLPAANTCDNYYLRLYAKGSNTYNTIAGSASPVPANTYCDLEWSPDGNTLYAADCGSTPFTLHVYSRSGGNLTHVKTIDKGAAWLYNFDVHPSGNYIALGNPNNSNWAMPGIVADPLGAETIMGDGSGYEGWDWYSSVAWSPDGNYLAVSQENGEFYIYAFNPANPPAYFTSETVTGFACVGQNQGVAFSSDSQYVAVTTSNGTTNLCILKRDGAGWTNIIANGDYAPAWMMVPVWSK